MHEKQVNENLYQNVLKTKSRVKHRNLKYNGSVLVD